jgi:Raf kinase inhibitor-like YbhB/YbcL family protein
MLRKLLIAAAVLTFTAGTAFSQDKGGTPPPPGMALTTPDFQDGGILPDRYTQADPNPVSPRLEWTNAPQGTQSFVLIMHDPDGAPNKMPEDVLHWLAFNIPGTTRSLPGAMSLSASLPDGTVQGKNIRGAPGYMGPGNPARNPYHHYTWDLFALDSKLALGPEATRAEVIKAMEGHVIGKAVLGGRFKRPQ